jgi:GntR family transcriptional regulator
MVKRLHFHIDPHAGAPVYRQLMDQLKYYVGSGALRAGDQLPSIRELAQMLSVNPTTIVKAYTELEHEQVIEMRHGKGAFVCGPSLRMSQQEREIALRQLARKVAVEAAQVGASTDLVVRLVKEEIEDLEHQAAAADLGRESEARRRIAHG